MPPDIRFAVDTPENTADSDLRAADPARLALVLRECQMPMVVIRTPGDIVREFAGR